MTSPLTAFNLYVLATSFIWSHKQISRCFRLKRMPVVAEEGSEGAAPATDILSRLLNKEDLPRTPAEESPPAISKVTENAEEGITSPVQPTTELPLAEGEGQAHGSTLEASPPLPVTNGAEHSPQDEPMVSAPYTAQTHN